MLSTKVDNRSKGSADITVGVICWEETTVVLCMAVGMAIDCLVVVTPKSVTGVVGFISRVIEERGLLGIL